MNKEDYKDIKEEFKKMLLQREQELIISTTKIDSQQIVSRIIKDFENLSEGKGVNENDNK